MKLNPIKCTFGVVAGKLGHVVMQRGIEVSPYHIKELMNIQSPRNVKKSTKLTKHVATFNRFI